jgi:adenylate kinase family enzyme
VSDRVLIYGVTGSGKTTLAQKVADRTGLPFHSVDDLTWDLQRRTLDHRLGL